MEQGEQGDPWLLAAVSSLTLTPRSAQMLMLMQLTAEKHQTLLLQLLLSLLLQLLLLLLVLLMLLLLLVWLLLFFAFLLLLLSPLLLLLLPQVPFAHRFLDRVVPPDQNFDHGYCGVFR